MTLSLQWIVFRHVNFLTNRWFIFVSFICGFWWQLGWTAWLIAMTPWNHFAPSGLWKRCWGSNIESIYLLYYRRGATIWHRKWNCMCCNMLMPSAIHWHFPPEMEDLIRFVLSSSNCKTCRYLFLEYILNLYLVLYFIKQEYPCGVEFNKN